MEDEEQFRRLRRQRTKSTPLTSDAQGRRRLSSDRRNSSGRRSLTLLALVWVVLVASDTIHTRAFSPMIPFTKQRHSISTTSTTTCLHSLDDMRALLESAWNVPAMGQVPTTPALAAEAAALAVQNALAQNILSMVDILLPQYNPAQSDKVYDELLAVEFCIELAQTLNHTDGHKTSIVVRDQRTIDTVSRILDRREQAPAETDVATARTSVDTDDDDDDEANDEEDDFPVDIDKESIDSFRAKLLATEWNLDDDNDETTTPSEPTGLESTTPVARPSSYRLCSMMGNATMIRSGRDMPLDVVEAVKAHALPRDDEDTIIILSANSPPELVAIRALVAQYETTKQIVLVNCRATDPLPPELSNAQTVYSVLPLVGKPVVDNNTRDTSNEAKTTQQSPRIVVLRRFPRDWEIFVDTTGSSPTAGGFELVATAPVLKDQPKGPPLSWIVNKVQEYLSTNAI